MTVGDWCDVAWAQILDDAPMLANPGEFRSMMYDYFWEGKSPPPPKKTAQRGRRGSSEPVMPKPSRGPSKATIAELQREAARIQALQQAKQ